MRSLGQPHYRRKCTQRGISRDGYAAVALNARGPCHNATRDGREVAAVADDGHVRGGDVEDADQACESVAGDLVWARVGRWGLLRPRLVEEDAPVLVAAVYVY